MSVIPFLLEALASPIDHMKECYFLYMVGIVKVFVGL